MKDFHRWLTDLTDRINGSDEEKMHNEINTAPVDVNENIQKCLVCNEDITWAHDGSLQYCSYECYSGSDYGVANAPIPWGNVGNITIHDYEDGDLDRYADWEQEDRLNTDFYGD